MFMKKAGHFELKDNKEARIVEVEGVLEENEKAPNGIEIRMRT